MKTHGTITNKINLWLVGRLFFACIFILSGVIKFADIKSFGEALGNFKMLSPQVFPFVIILLPSIETILGLFLFFNIGTKYIIRFFTFLLVFFTSVLIAKVVEGEKLYCYCFGSLSNSEINSFAILRNIFFILIGIVLYNKYGNKSQSNIDHKLEKCLNIFNVENLRLFISELTTMIRSLVFFYLISQVFILSMQNKNLKQSLSVIVNNSLQPSEVIKPFKIVDKNDNVLQVDFVNYNWTVIFFISTRCESCIENLPILINLKTKLTHKDINVFSVTLDSTEDIIQFCSKNVMNFELYSVLDNKTVEDLKLFKTPQLLIINSEGKVIRSFTGIISQETVNRILKLFS